jgi:hypothetical protein
VIWRLAIGVFWLAPCLAAAQSSTPWWNPTSSNPALLQPPAAAVPTNIHPAVARIVAPGKGSISYGSGTLIYAQDNVGLVITNWHVVNEAAGQISVHFPDGFYSAGNILRADKDWDLAIVVIRRPPAVEPVPLAEQAPRPGETLTIAGYGSGEYRAASGACTQYVAPGTTFPYEMVEVAVSARQGDSGGPILNSRGELAGVLFGEGHGRTSGSYCGRVRWFLSSVVPQPPATRQIASQGPQATTQLAQTPARSPDLQSNDQPRKVPVPLPMYAARPYQAAANSPEIGRPATETVGPSRGAEPVSLEAQELHWEDLAGHTFVDQAKTVLAATGLLLMVLHLLRWVGAEPSQR